MVPSSLSHLKYLGQTRRQQGLDTSFFFLHPSLWLLFRKEQSRCFSSSSGLTGCLTHCRVLRLPHQDGMYSMTVMYSFTMLPLVGCILCLRREKYLLLHFLSQGIQPIGACTHSQLGVGWTVQQCFLLKCLPPPPTPNASVTWVPKAPASLLPTNPSGSHSLCTEVWG